MKPLFTVASMTKVYSATNENHCCRGKCDCNTCSVRVPRIRDNSTGFLSRFSVGLLRCVFFWLWGIVRNFCIGNGKACCGVAGYLRGIAWDLILFDTVDNLGTSRFGGLRPLPAALTLIQPTLFIYNGDEKIAFVLCLFFLPYLT